MGVQCQATSWNCQGRHGKEKQLAVNALKFEMLVQATMASTGSALVGLAVPTWASLQVLLAGDLIRQGSWLRYWLVFAIAELLALPVPYMKLASPFLFCLYLSKLALLVCANCPLKIMEAKSYLDRFSS